MPVTALVVPRWDRDPIAYLSPPAAQVAEARVTVLDPVAVYSVDEAVD